MGAVTKNILTVTEPTIELDTFDIPDVEAGDGSRDKNHDHLSKYTGDTYPAIRINEYDFGKQDIEYFKLSIRGFLPTLTVTIRDTRGVFSLSHYPKDGDVLSLYIRSKDEEVFKPIRSDFDIINVDGPPVGNQTNRSYSMSTEEGGLKSAGAKFTFECIMKVPNLLGETCQGFDEDTSFNHLEKMAEELKLGFASNVTDTSDKMVRFCPFDTRIKFIKDHTETAYKDDNSFFTSYIDPYYYLNFVDVNQQLQYDDNVEDSLATIVEDLTVDKGAKDAEPAFETKLYLTNLDKGHVQTSKYVAGYNIVNNASEVSLKNGYKRIIQYYDDDDKEYRTFDIEALTGENLPKDLNPLKNRNDKEGEDRYKNQVKYKYVGKQSSGEKDGNTHLNYLYSIINNYQNLQELNKMYIDVDLPTANMTLYRFQKVPLIIYETDAHKTTVMKQREDNNKEAGGETRENEGTGDAENTGFNSPKVNTFLTGVYVITGIDYIYSQSNQGIKQRVSLYRREWPNGI